MDGMLGLFIVGTLCFAGVGVIWVVGKALGFVAGLLTPERPAARAPRPRPYPPSPDSPPALQPRVLPPVRTAAQMERAEVLNALRRELYQALNLHKISATSYRELSDYVSRERDAIRAGAGAAGITPPEPLELPQPQPLLKLMEEQPMELPGDSPQPEPMHEQPLELVNEAAMPAALPKAAEPEPTLKPVLRIPAAAAAMTPQGGPRDPERIRAAIAKLHADAQAPVAPDETAAQQPAPACIESSSEPPAAHGTPAAAAVSHPQAQPGEVFASKKTFAERFFTPENVRILQSLGISIFFISAVAFIRTQMWNDASPLARLLILMAGTVTCIAAGFSLRRWLSLRITGLGFMVLGQLSLVLDAYSTLLDTGGAHSIYPYSPQSLWTYAFLLFAVSGACMARWTKEPLFEAFTYFGALAAWAAGALWLGVEPLLLPAAFVPALILSGLLAHLIRPASQPDKPKDEAATAGLSVPRWSLPWWLAAGFEAGSVLLAVALPVCALLAGRESLAAHAVAHFGAMAALAMAMLAGCELPSKLSAAPMLKNPLRHAGTLLFMTLAPLAAHTFTWAPETWPAAFALPGALLALSSLALQRSPRRRELAAVFRGWALAPVLAGLGWSLLLRAGGASGAGLIACGAAALIVTTGFALLNDAEWAPPFATIAAAFLAWLGLDAARAPIACFPAAGLALALCAHGCWTALRRKVSDAGRWSADCLALAAGAYLLALTPVLPATVAATPVAWPVSAGWAALLVFALGTSLWAFADWRRACAVALASPALCYALYHYGVNFGAPAPWLALLAAAAVLAARFGRKPSEHATALGAAAIVTHGIVLALWQSSSALPAAASASFAFLSLPLLLHAQLQRKRSATSALLSGCETAALLLLAISGVNAAWAQHILPMQWPLALMLIAASILALAKAGELLAGPEPHNPAPFRAAGEIAALGLSAAAFAVCVCLSDCALALRAQLLTTVWLCGLLPLFIAVRGARRNTPHAATTLGGVAAGAFALLALEQAAQSEFWLAACPAQLRAACAVFFAALLGLSSFGVWRRIALAAFPAALAALGLLGCAIGLGYIPPQAFGLGCMLIAMGATALKRLEPDGGATLCAETSAWIARGAGALHLLYGLIVWPAGAMHALPLLAWTVLSAEAWMRLPRRRYAFIAAGALLPAAAAAMRWLGLDFDSFGPGLAALALTLTIAATMLQAAFQDGADVEVLRRQHAANTADAVGWVARLSGVLAFIAGLWGAHDHQSWQWSVTLAELAACFFVGSIHLRRLRPTPALSPQGRPFGLELCSWALLIGAACTALSTAGLVLTPASWVLLGALCLLLGMAGEALVPALSGETNPAMAPAYLESRHFAALALSCMGLIHALAAAPQGAPNHELWRVLFGMSALALYGSFAHSAAVESTSQLIRKLCAGAAYIVLLPAGYLCFLIAHANGGSWGAMYLMLLAPVQLAAAAVLRREERKDQSELAAFGALLVGAGSLLLAFAANHAHLAQVPAATLLALAAELALLRWMTGRRWYSSVACLALAGAAFFGAQAAVGLALYGPQTPWAWQIVFVSLASLAMIVLGGSLRVDEAPVDARADSPRVSLVAVMGMFQSALAVLFALMIVLMQGVRAPFPPIANMEYLDALIACVLLLSGAAMCATRWLAPWAPMKAISRYLAPGGVIAGYALFMLKSPPVIWEPYTIPVAFFLFAWARETARAAEREGGETGLEPAGNHELTWMLALASAVLVLPSFLEAIPHSRAASEHYITMMSLSLVLVFGAMVSRRKIPLLAGAFMMVTGTIMKAIQWAQHREGLAPLLGIVLGLLLLGVSTLFESRMNRAFRKAVDKARAEARMFWVSWQ